MDSNHTDFESFRIKELFRKYAVACENGDTEEMERIEIDIVSYEKQLKDK